MFFFPTELLWPLYLILALVLVFLVVRSLIRGDRVRRDAWYVVHGKRAATLADLDTYLREIRAAPVQPGDEELLRCLAALREELARGPEGKHE